MKKFIGLAFCLAMVIGMTACDDASETSVTNPEYEYPEMYGLAGTSWVKESITDSIFRSDRGGSTAPYSYDFTEIPRKRSTMTINFNADGTFSALYENQYTPEWDAEYTWLNDGDPLPATVYMTEALVPETNAGSRTQHASATDNAFTDYSDQYCNGQSNVLFEGTWERIKKESIIDQEDNYTYDYRVKILHKVLTTYTVNETITDYLAENSYTYEYTYSEEDADWSDAIAETSMSVGGLSEGQELQFTLGGSMGSPFASGTYTLR